MAKVEVGGKAIDFVYETPFAQGIKLSEKVKEADKTFLVFLRYYGCTICKLDMILYKEAYDKFKEKNAQILLVLQSPPSTLLEEGKLTEDSFPYDIVCNPDQSLYGEYELGVAADKEELVPAAIMPAFEEKRKLMVQYRLAHGSYEGEELQQPGMFLFDSDMNVLYAKRATHLMDKPEIDEMLAML